MAVDEVSKVNAANGGYVVMRNGEQFNASLQDFTGKPLIAVFSNGRRSNIGDVARIYFGSVEQRSWLPDAVGEQPECRAEPSDARAGRPSGAAEVVVAIPTPIVPPHRQTPGPSWCRRTCSGPTPV